MHALNLQQLPKIDIKQENAIAVFFDCFEHFVRESGELFDTAETERFLDWFGKIKASRPTMFKEFDDGVSDFLKKQLIYATNRLQKGRPETLSRFEETFQSFRGLPTYDPILSKICPTHELSNSAPKKTLIAGCGRCPEARFLLQTFPQTTFSFNDINDSDLALLKERLQADHTQQAHRFSVQCSDLRLADSFIDQPFDSFIFFHPLLLDFGQYAQLLRGLASERDSKTRRELVAQSRMSSDSRQIFDSLVGHLPSGGTAIITVVDGFEAQALNSYLAQCGISYSVEYNPYALKKLGVIITAGLTPREAEQRTYHYVFRLKKH